MLLLTERKIVVGFQAFKAFKYTRNLHAYHGLAAIFAENL
jgi:hypothetical protein